MVIGNKGAKIKTIGIEARKDMQDMFEAPVHLELWVKVKSGWADDERALRSLGYGDAKFDTLWLSMQAVNRLALAAKDQAESRGKTASPGAYFSK
jgi:hypothetical protein